MALNIADLLTPNLHRSVHHQRRAHHVTPHLHLKWKLSERFGNCFIPTSSMIKKSRFRYLASSFSTCRSPHHGGSREPCRRANGTERRSPPLITCPMALAGCWRWFWTCLV